MREIQIYIEDQRLDLFDNETIEVKSSIQDAKDISKVFTDFSKEFSIPASSVNNKIFKHFYNFNISSGAFDARVRHEAKIFINHLLFKKGKIFLSGVSMKDKKPNTYKITFFGNTVSLKDVFGDDKLIALNNYTDETKGLNRFDHEFSYSNVKTIFSGTGLNVFSDSSALIYPLITSKKRLFYDSTLANTSIKNYDGNVYAPTTGYDIDRYRKRGVKENDLKPAIKVYHIIKSIEEKYGINLIQDDTSGTKDFFSIHNEAFSNLYLWMSNSSGNIDGEIADDEYIYKASVGSWTETRTELDYASADGNEVVLDSYALQGLNGLGQFVLTKFFLDVTPDSGYGDVNYRIKLTNSKTGRSQVFQGSGTKGYRFKPPVIFIGDEPVRYIVEFYSETPMLNTNIRFRVRAAGDAFLDQYDYDDIDSGAVIDTDTATVSLVNHLPDIKIIDFITGLFKMFNLTAYYIDDETDPEYGDGITPEIKVMTLDNYFADAVNNQSGGTIDITKYIDASAHQVNTSLPFNEIDFKFEKADSIINENHAQLTGQEFGNSHLPVNFLYPDFFFGEKYEIKVPFSKLKYERILGTDIQWGYAAGGDFNHEDPDYSDSNDIEPPKGNYNSTNVKALLFYGVRETGISNNINFSDSSNTTVSLVTNYYRPSNTNETAADDETPADFSINFDSEIDEWTGSENLNSLFEVFYKKYIESVFEPSKRISKFTAYMPPSFLIHYKLNDQLKIQDEVYRINSITTNLTSGKTSLELINLKSDEII